MPLTTWMRTLETAMLTGASAGNTFLYLFSSPYTPTRAASSCWVIQLDQKMSVPQKKPHRRPKSIAGLLQNAKHSTPEAGAQTTYACWLLPRCGGCFNRPTITEKNQMILLHTSPRFLHSLGLSSTLAIWQATGNSVVTEYCAMSDFPELEKKKNCPNVGYVYFPVKLFSNFSLLVCQARYRASFTCLPIPTNPGFGKSWLTQQKKKY